ncbi:GNAT family N-acetyltransferase [Ornithinimicrobium tianjinense]|nr:GNAT family N-acetyltransferase [Ornithinimicrobium tianjinense]
MSAHAAPTAAPRLVSGDLRLVAPAPAHEQMLVELGRDEECLRWGDASPTGAPTQARSWTAVAAERWSERLPYSPRQWVVEVLREGVWRAAGTVEYRPDGHGAAEVGYAVHPAFRDNRVAVRALDLALEHAFTQDDVDTARWRAEVGNWASRRVAWRLGFSAPLTVRGLLPGHGQERRPRDGWVASLRHDEARTPAYPWLVVPTLEAGGVVLRPWRHTDAGRIVEACQDPVSQRYLPALPRPYGIGEAMAYVDRVRDSAARGTELAWCVTETGADVCVGSVALFGLGTQPGQAEVGYLAHPQVRGRGLLTVAVQSACRYALTSLTAGGLGLDRLLLRAAESNAPSRKVALAVGMTQTGRDRRAERLGDGTVEDMVRFDLLAGEITPL